MTLEEEYKQKTKKDARYCTGYHKSEFVQWIKERLIAAEKVIYCCCEKPSDDFYEAFEDWEQIKQEEEGK